MVAGGRVTVMFMLLCILRRLDGIISVWDHMSMSSVEELVMLSIWKRVDPKITKRKMPSNQGPICEDSYFF
jgi:hypothetical protein